MSSIQPTPPDTSVDGSTDAIREALYQATLATLDGEAPEGSAVGRIPAKTYQDLQWPKVIEGLLAHSVSREGSEVIQALSPLPQRDLARRRLEEVGEYVALIEEGDEAPIYGLRDIRKAVAHASREGVLIAEDLEAIARNCDVASRTRRFFVHRREVAPRLAAVAERLDPSDTLRDALNHAVEPGGRLSDHASPDLKRLRRAVQNQTDRIKSRVDQLLQSSQMEHLLQDDYFTVREDRYVFPVRVGAKNAVDGIVHGYSSSGQTAFVEPNELIELNNELRWAQIAVEDEEQRILTRLSALVAQAGEPLARNTEIFAYLDLVQAAGKFSRSIDAHVPTLSDREVYLEQARHPLLYLKLARQTPEGQPNPTVPNDIAFDPERRVLIISGPNTGGKTVLLKTLGLCALMARCGLPVPAGPGSKVPFYGAIFTDIGDEQSIDRDLSTFSSHLVNINGFLERTDEDTLVLLDELFTGTDPMQGAALAVSLLEELSARGATTVVTTHLEGLKTLALEDAHFANASMGFDIQTLAPTYDLTLGIPGSSFAIRIADRLGFPEKLVGRAREVLEGEGKLSVDEVLAKLEDQVAGLKAEQKRLEQSRYEAQKTRDKFKKKYDDLRARERDFVHGETRKLKEQLDRARKLVRQREKELKADSGTVTRKDLESMRDELEEARKELDLVRERTAPPKPTPEGLVRVEPDELREGMEVYAAPFKRNATVLQYAEGDKEAQIQVGLLKAQTALDELFYPTESARRRHTTGGGGGAERHPPRETPSEIMPQTKENTLDLRGSRVDEALEMLDLFLDHAYLKGQPGVYIIHGHGTGALKRAVRGNLPQSPYVRDFRRGERGEGGDGVTVAFMAANVPSG